ncbi:MAG: molybdopterin-guanine dinucleotide biosynthesis protein MobA [Microbacteriaceae bacterium]|nr:molybdopterin-guanine dinucleotide biosynthesis protein MobA [Microbacteriaceae bacterium]
MSESSRNLPPEALEAWAAALRSELHLPDELPIALILDLARDVAAGVARPAAPLSAFAAGLAAGRAGGSPEDVRTAVNAVTRRAADWTA